MKSRTHFYEFDDFRLDLSSRRLYCRDHVVPLTPRVFDLLVVLVQNNGEVLEKRFLLSEVWSDAIVEEHSLTQAVSVLRKVLGETPNNYRYIMTVSGRGYRFIASVNEIVEDGASAEESAVRGVETRSRQRPGTRWLIPAVVQTPGSSKGLAATFLLIGLVAGILPTWFASNARRAVNGATPKSVAVMPFHAVDKESCNSALSSTVTNALVTKLTQSDELRVLPIEHNCSENEGPAHQPETTNEIRAQVVIDGQVQKLGDKFQVSVRLVRTSDGAALWARQFETGSPRDDNFTDQISDEVAVVVLNQSGREN
jgi:DNA-binding winged helix-turn-helix (wHTH) protein/TolB-like protein